MPLTAVLVTYDASKQETREGQGILHAGPSSWLRKVYQWATRQHAAVQVAVKAMQQVSQEAFLGLSLHDCRAINVSSAAVRSHNQMRSAGHWDPSTALSTVHLQADPPHRAAL